MKSKDISVTIDYGVLESSHFYITTDEKKYNELISNGAIPMFNPTLLTNLSPENEQDIQLYVVRTPQDK